MPIVPAPQKMSANIRQLPSVSGFTISGDQLGGGAWAAIGRAGQDIGRAVGEMGANFERVRQLKDAEVAEGAVSQYVKFAGDTLSGRMDETTGQVSEGMLHREAGAAQNMARDFAKAQNEWHENPDGTFAKLTPAQRDIYNQRVEKHSQRFQGLTVDHELKQLAVQRAANAHATAATAVQQRDALVNADETTYGAAVSYAAEAGADSDRHGTFVREVDGTRTFKSPEMRGAWEAALAAYVEQGLLKRADYNLDLAARAPLGDQPDDPIVEGYIAAAQGQMVEEMSPPAREKISRGIEIVRAQRARLEDAAAKDEEISAYVALAEGSTYNPGGIPRKVAALERANKKWGAEQLKIWSAKAKESRKENSAYASEMAATGFWKNEAGEIVPLSTDDQYSVLRAALYSGDVTLADYKKAEHRVQQREQSQNKEAYDRAVQDVAQIYGHTIKTVWTDQGAALAGSEDPNSLVFTYKHETTYSKNGEEKKRREYRKLLASDIPVLVNLLANARKVDGMRLDLDGNVMTEPEMMDAGRYRPALLRQLQDKLFTVDIHSNMQAIVEAQRQLETQRALGYAIALGGSFERGQPMTTQSETEDNSTEPDTDTDTEETDDE